MTILDLRPKLAARAASERAAPVVLPASPSPSQSALGGAVGAATRQRPAASPVPSTVPHLPPHMRPLSELSDLLLRKAPTTLFGVVYQHLAPAEVVCLDALLAYSEIVHGHSLDPAADAPGIEAFLTSVAGTRAHEAVQALRTIGAVGAAATLERALSLWEEATAAWAWAPTWAQPRDGNQLFPDDREHFERLSERFVWMRGSVRRRLVAYARAQRLLPA